MKFIVLLYAGQIVVLMAIIGAFSVPNKQFAFVITTMALVALLMLAIDGSIKERI